MGSGIATACILAGVDVLLKEVNQQFLDVSDTHPAQCAGISQLLSCSNLRGGVCISQMCMRMARERCTAS